MAQTRQDIQTFLDVLDRRLHAIEAEREALGAERLILLRTRQYYETLGEASSGGVIAADAKRTPSPPSPPPVFSTMGLTEAVRSYIQRFPGYTAPQVTDALETVVKTTAKDRRKTISWMITDLIRRGVAERREEGKLYPTHIGRLIAQGELIEDH